MNSSKRKSMDVTIEKNDKRKIKKPKPQPQSQSHPQMSDIQAQLEPCDVGGLSLIDQILSSGNMSQNGMSQNGMLLCIEDHRIVEDGWMFACQFTNKSKQLWIHEREIKNLHIEHLVYYLKKNIPENK